MTLKSERQAVVGVLTGVGIAAFDYIPARLAPPAAVVMTSAPYLQPTDTFGHLKARYDISLIVGTASNEKATSDLDALIEDAVVAFINAGYDVEQVSEFKVYPSNNAEYPAVDITIAKDIQI